MPRPVLWYLQKVDLFSSMTDEEMMDVIENMEDHEYACKHVLYTPEDLLEHSYILKEGEVTLYQQVGDKRVVLDILKPGAMFGSILEGDGVEEGHFAEVTQDSYICTLPHDFFVRLAQKRPDIALKAIQTLSRQLSEYHTHVRLLSMLSAQERILVMMHLINRKDDRSILPSILRIPTKLTHEKLGGLTGLTRETVTKQLQELERRGLIQVQKKHIRLTEMGSDVVAGLL